MTVPLDSLFSQKPSDSGIRIQLHPLVILTISDQIVRHAARQRQGPIVGALLGQQNGRDITLEHAFECIAVENQDGEVHLQPDWFAERVTQLKDVHKDPPMDVVGWWSTTAPVGPAASHLPIQRQILQGYNESAVFLAFHPSQLQNPLQSAGKLPLTIYESVYEGDYGDNEKKMQVDGEEQPLNIRFRELPYSVETGEAEIIGIDTISRTGRSATIHEGRPVTSQQPGSGKVAGEKDDATLALLSQEDEELISSLSARLNAIRALESRISLIKSYLSSLCTTSEDQRNPDSEEMIPTTHLSYPILRNVSSVLSHLALLTPHEQSPLTAEMALQSNDVLLVSVLGLLSESIRDMRELGKKAGIIRSVRHSTISRKAQFAMQSRFEKELTASQDSQDSPAFRSHQ